jgi:predicted nucleic acid-binding protein
MKPRVYVETSVLSYLTSWPSGDLVAAGRQKITRDWWRLAQGAFELTVSELVQREAGEGDPQAARDRQEATKGLRVLAVDERVRRVARALLAGKAVPPSEAEDALHIALAVVNGVEYLVTWNLKHIANALMRSKIERACIAEGYNPCIICTPEELMEFESNV